jgi:flagellar biosynthesis anti-sigma factor FlgM
MVVEGVTTMVTPISNSGPGKVEKQPFVTLPPVAVEDRRDAKVEPSTTPAARYAKLGPPIDVTRVNEVRAAIANGSYTVDADRLAEAMLALDLPARDA